MTEEHFTKLWKWLALFCFAYVIGSVFSIQGGVDVFGAKLFADIKKDGREVVACFAAIVGSGAMSLALLVAVIYARRFGTAWHDRFPVVFLDGLQTGSREGKIFQSAVILLLVVLPLIGIVKCITVANEGVICEQEPQDKLPVFHESNQWRLLQLPAHEHQIRLMTHDADRAKCGGSGVEVGWYTPFAFGGLPIVTGGLLVAWLWALLRAKASPVPASS